MVEAIMKDRDSDIAPIIDVTNQYADGWHTFTSPQIPGLYIVAPKDDLEQAYCDIPAAIEMLIEADKGKKVTVKMRPEYNEYLQRLPAHQRPLEIRHYEVLAA